MAVGVDSEELIRPLSDGVISDRVSSTLPTGAKPSEGQLAVEGLLNVRGVQINHFCSSILP